MKKSSSHMSQDIQYTNLLRVISERFDRLESQMATKDDIKFLRKEMKLEFKDIRRSLAHLAETSPTLDSFQRLESRVNRYLVAS